LYYEIKQWFSAFTGWFKQKTGAPITVGYFLMDQLVLGVVRTLKERRNWQIFNA
jgi:hypothetical protein